VPTTNASEIETLVTGYGLVEGPRVDAENRLYFSDARLGGVFCREPGGEVETVVPKRRGVGGIVLHAEGGIVVSGKNICHVRDGVSRVVFELEGVPGFNDLYTDARGRVLVGSQLYSPFEKDAQVIPGHLYRVESEGKAETLYDDVGLTNGIGFSPDGSRLYHSDSARNHVLVHDVASDGAVTNRRVFVAMPRGAPDGLAVDAEGFVWVATFGAGGVSRFTPEGELERHLEVPARGVTSVTFGGPDLRDLYVATADKSSETARGGSIFRTRSPAPGLRAPLATV
jgi:gluconolactonase